MLFNLPGPVSASGTFLATGRGSVDLRRALRAGNFFVGRRVKKGMPGWTFTVTPDAAGVRFWVRMFRPITIVEFPWAESDRVTTGRGEGLLTKIPPRARGGG
jgi:hypothetical protein